MQKEGWRSTQFQDRYAERERAKLMKEWDEAQVRKSAIWAERLKVKGVVVYHDRMTRESFLKLLPSKSLISMFELKHPFGSKGAVAKELTELCSYATMYYKDILTSRTQGAAITLEVQEGNRHWENTSINFNLSQSGRLDLDRLVTEQEAKEALKAMAKGKVPGCDGLPTELYVELWQTIGGELVEIYNQVLTGGRLASNMCKGVISVLFKKGERSEIRNWRPVSLLNISYKILANILARNQEDSHNRSFGRSWIEKGVLRIRDIRDNFVKNWMASGELKTKLGQLREVQERLATVIEAIPEEWKILMSPESAAYPGTWYTQQEEQGFSLGDLKQTQTEEKRIFQKWNHQKKKKLEVAEPGSQPRLGTMALSQARVIPRDQEGTRAMELVANGKLIAELKLENVGVEGYGKARGERLSVPVKHPEVVARTRWLQLLAMDPAQISEALDQMLLGTTERDPMPKTSINFVAGVNGGDPLRGVAGGKGDESGSEMHKL
ncbi:hypothetical protein CBR_g37962 [Chara braunii]|uniref:Reverse transcriptase domain-containing protein n=1 Tax=Chara braunii TaxID=69332 RepID=A0A388LP28_CHABU|nr:hypothetical protein CBR_g37962 [Chara braunii]|eukprot:GBG84087.1 hypothetical protein CBR_g37962 [Chara braunii]